MNIKNLTPLIIVGSLILLFGLAFWYISSNDQSLPSQEITMKDQTSTMMPGTEDQGNNTQAEYIDISPQVANELINSDPELIIIDVSPNYAEGHLPGAVNYYIGDRSLDRAIPTLDRSKTYLVYCHADGAAIAGAQKLIDAGFTKVYRLEGNYSGWVDAGYPIETPSN